MNKWYASSAWRKAIASARPNHLPTETRAAIQASHASVRELARRYGVNPKTIQRWRHRHSTEDRLCGAPASVSTALSAEDEITIVLFRQVTLLALDDCLYALQPLIPRLRRSTLHRCLQRNGIAALPPSLRARRDRETGRVGHFYIFVIESRTQSGTCHLFGAVDRATRFAITGLRATADANGAAEFLAALRTSLPCRLDAVITDVHPCFTDAFGRACTAFGIKHIPTPLLHPGVTQVCQRPPMYQSPEDLREKLRSFLTLANYRQRLKALGGITPYEALTAAWRVDPLRFYFDPQMMNKERSVLF